MSPRGPLLAAKLLPPTPGPFHLQRRRLLERLGSALDGRVTAVVGGPGCGKTALAAQLVHSRPCDSVWYRLDPSDHDAWTFFRYLVHGLREQLPEFGASSEGLWNEFGPPGQEIERLVDVFIHDVEESLGGPMLVVLDEVHHLESSPECLRALKRLVAYLPGTLHLLLVGRSLPEIGLQTLRAEGRAHLLDGRDLLLTRDETAELLRDTFGLEISDDTVTRIHERTRGWITALQLLRQTASLQGSAAGLTLDVFARTDAEIFDYFSEEVLAAEEETIRGFLLESCVPAVIDAELCAEVLDGCDVRGILAGLLRRNLFLTALESRGEFYAYDPLFRDFLLRKLLAVRGAAGIRALERRYGQACARRGEFDQALACALRAEDAEGIADLLARRGRALLRAGSIDIVRDTAAFLDARGLRPALAHDLLGEACRLAGDYAAAVGHFEKSMAARSGTGDGAAAGVQALEGLAYALLRTGDLERAAGTAQTGLAAAPPSEPGLRARLLNTLAIVRYRENRLPEAIEGWRLALAETRRADDRHLTLMVAHNLGLPHAARGDFARASECFEILTGADNPRLGPEEAAAFLNLARISLLQGDTTRAASLLGDAKEIAHTWRLRALSADVLESEGTLWRETGDLERAQASYARARALLTELGLQEPLDSVLEEEAILAARQGAHDQARRIMAGVLERRHARADVAGLASSQLALGEVLLRAGNATDALAPLTDAAATFDSLEHAYQSCLARLWLAMALLRTGRPDAAVAAATAALDRAAEFDYAAAVVRVATLDADLRRLLATLPGTPAALRQPEPEPGAGLTPARAPVPSGTDLSLRLLGAFEAWRDPQRRIPGSAWKTRRARQVLCFIASARQHRASKDRIVDALWGEARPSTLEKNFHPTISFLRAALNHGSKVPKNFILFEGGAYYLNPAYRYDIDADELDKGVRQARSHATRGEHREALAAFDTALGHYRGPFLEDEYGEWAEAPRAHYAALVVTALLEAGELHLARGDADRGIALLERAVDLDPLDEARSCRLMRALGSRGNRGAVEREFQRLSRALEQELRAAPLPATRQAHAEAIGLRRTRG